MTPVTLTKSERHYLKQAAGAPEGVLTEYGAFGVVPLRHLVELGYLTFEGAGGNLYKRTYHITDAGRAALVATPVTDVSQVEHVAAPMSEHTAKKVRELNARLERANAARLVHNLDAPLVFYKFRWDSIYDGVKLESPRPGAPVWADRGLINCEAAIDDYQRAGITAMKTIQRAESEGRDPEDLHAHFAATAAAYEDRYGHGWKWTGLVQDRGTWYALHADGNRDYLGSASRARAALDTYLERGIDNAAARRAGTPAPAETPVAVSAPALASNDTPEKPDAAPEYGRWVMETQLALSAALIKFGHSIGADKARPGVLVIGITQRKHDLVAWEVLQAALPPDAALTHVKAGVFHVTRRPAPAAPVSAPAAVAGEDSDKRGQRPVTDTSALRSSTNDAAQVRQSSVTREQLDPFIPRHKRLTRHLVHQATCVQCGKRFTASRSDAKTCSATCRKAYSRREAELRKAYEEAQRALAEIGARLRKHPDLADQAADNLETLAREAARLLAECQRAAPSA